MGSRGKENHHVGQGLPGRKLEEAVILSGSFLDSPLVGRLRGYSDGACGFLLLGVNFVVGGHCEYVMCVVANPWAWPHGLRPL